MASTTPDLSTTPDFSGIQVKWSDIKAISNYFDIFLNDYPISAEVKWCIAQLQLPALILYAKDTTILENSNSAFRLLLKSILAVDKYVSRYYDAQKMPIQATPVISYAKDIITEAKNCPHLDRWLSLSAELADFLQKADQPLVPKVSPVLEVAEKYEQKQKEISKNLDANNSVFSVALLETTCQEAEAKTYRDLEVFAYKKKLLAQERSVHVAKSLESQKNNIQEMSAVEKQLLRERKQLQSYIAQVELLKVGMRLMYQSGRRSMRLRLLKKLEDKIVFAEDKTHTVIEKTFDEVALDLKKGLLRIILVPFLS